MSSKIDKPVSLQTLRSREHVAKGLCYRRCGRKQAPQKNRCEECIERETKYARGKYTSTGGKRGVAPGTSKLTPYHEVIVECLNKGWGATEMSRFFKESGFKVSYITISKYMKRHNLVKKKVDLNPLLKDYEALRQQHQIPEPTADLS